MVFDTAMSARMSIRSKIAECLVLGDSVLTCVQIHRMTGIRLATLSSALNRLVKGGYLVRISGHGPRGGYGYRRKTMEEVLRSVDPNSPLEV
jgi:DNA-binding HxlR family transcriptional regulator